MSAPAGAPSISPHCRSSVRSRRSAIYISPLPQQCLLPQELSLRFPTAAAVPAPAGAPSIPPHCRSSVCSHRSTIFISPLPQQYLPSHPPSSPHTATPVHFSRSRSFLQDASRSLSLRPLSFTPPPPSISSLPQQCSLQQEPLPPLPLSPSQQPHATIGTPPPAVFFTTAVVPALAGTFPIFPHCRSSACSNRNLLYISPTAPAVTAPTGALSIFPLPL